TRRSGATRSSRSRRSSYTPASTTTAWCACTRSTRRASTTCRSRRTSSTMGATSSRAACGRLCRGQHWCASRLPQNLGFAGFRLHYPLKSRDYKDELIVFLGASYFRALGRAHVYGLSARALAIDTALPTGEEFPFFREFWLERPRPGAKELVLYALLDSPRVTGAYRF